MFTYPTLLWFLPILGAVVLIHLINMFRHRRVEWAAMEFILASYKKSRTRILLQQLLLLLLRTAAVAALILMFAGPKLEGKLFEWLTNTGTHHIVLLDDSYSMNERNLAQGSTPLFDEAIAVIQKIAAGHSNDRFTLIKLSDPNPLLYELPMSEDNRQTIQDVLQQLEPSSLATEPLTMLNTAENLLQQTSGVKPVIYFLSDFRQRNWKNPDPILKQIETLRLHGATVRMIRIAQPEQPNLTLESLQLVEGIHAADVDLLLDATVVNHGSAAAENVVVSLYVNEEMRAQQTVAMVVPSPYEGGMSRGNSVDQFNPSLSPEGGKIKNGARVRFPVRLAGSQAQRIEVRLQSDALLDDNQQYQVLQIPDALEVLLITSSFDTESAAQYVRVALAPGGTKSGIRIRQELPSFLAETPLEQFSAIFLLDLPTLEPSAIRALETYAANGGGIAFFPGTNTDLDFVRAQLYKEGAGLFPADPISVQELMPDYLSKVTDINVSSHPIFRLFNEGDSPLIGSVVVDRFLATRPMTDSSVNIWATLRNGAPLVLEKPFGKGKTMTFLTSASPEWNNWGRNPSYVVVLLELTAWLSKRIDDIQSYLVGDTLSLELDPQEFEEQVQWIPPQDTIPSSSGGGGTIVPGIYTAICRLRSGEEQLIYVPVNVSASEGDLRQSDPAILSDVLRTVGQSLESAAGFNTASDFDGQKSLSDALLALVLLFLVGETFLAGRILPPSQRLS